MNYKIKDARMFRVGDTLTLEDETVHKAVKDEQFMECNCSISKNAACINVKCATYNFHFKHIQP